MRGRRVSLHGLDGAISPADVGYPAAEIEAAGCLRFARANGSIEKMREVIRISAADEQRLQRMVKIGELSDLILFRAVAYRAAVLDEFDRLVSRERKRAAKQSIPRVPSIPAARNEGSQRSLVAASIATYKHPGGDRKSQGANLRSDISHEEAAASMGVSARTVDDAAKVLEEGSATLVADTGSPTLGSSRWRELAGV